jgi:hypothetical protein
MFRCAHFFAHAPSKPTHSQSASADTRQRRYFIASRKARAVIVSAFAFIVRSPIVGSFAQ